MEMQGDLIEQAIAAGKITICPPAVAAGHKRLKASKGKGKGKCKGQRLRSCVRCEAPVRFLKGKWAAYGQRRNAWHWVNEDGTHHRCSDYMETGVDKHAMQWRAAMERDSYQTGKGA